MPQSGEAEAVLLVAETLYSCLLPVPEALLPAEWSGANGALGLWPFLSCPRADSWHRLSRKTCLT